MSTAVPFERVGRYVVRRRIGSGGFATVWLAYDEQLDSPVAIKVLADNWALDDQVRRRFLEEGRYLRRVDSPHVVGVHDAGELADGRPYLVMTYADQGTLADRREALSTGQSLEVVRQVAAGLQALHDRDVLHRDVKPANVLFKASGGLARAMLGDLGLGKALDLSSRLTMIAGTPLFVAPEQAAAESPDARADQYSLAALAFLLLAGRPPYDHASLQAAADPGPPPALPDAFPAAASDVLRRGLARDPDARWPSVTDLAEALVAAVPERPRGVPVTDPDTVAHPPPVRPARGSGEPPTEPVPATVDGSPLPSPAPSPSPAPGRPGRRGRRSAWIAAAVVAVLLGAGGGWAVERRLPREATIEDDEGTLSVTVPDAWRRAVARDGWRPATEDAGATTFPALSAGTRDGWAEAAAGEGVFVGILPGDRLPRDVPQHPECDAVGDPLPDRSAAGDEMVTVVFTGCPGVTVERVVQLTANRLLWVQVRSASRATANHVLDGVRTSGI